MSKLSWRTESRTPGSGSYIIYDDAEGCGRENVRCKEMVGFVIVSHSETLAKGVVELTKMMADDVPIRAAGGLDDGSFGTSFEKISNAIEEVYSDDGVIVLMDMGSAVMTTEMVLELMPERKIVMADCPLVEGAVAATVSAMVGRSLDEIMNELSDVREQKKLQ